MSKRSKLSLKSKHSTVVKIDKSQKTIESFFNASNKKPELFSTVHGNASKQVIAKKETSFTPGSSTINHRTSSNAPDDTKEVQIIPDFSKSFNSELNVAEKDVKISDCHDVSTNSITTNIKPLILEDSSSEKNARKRCATKGSSPLPKRIQSQTPEDSHFDKSLINVVEKTQNFTQLKSAKCSAKNLFPSLEICPVLPKVDLNVPVCDINIGDDTKSRDQNKIDQVVSACCNSNLITDNVDSNESFCELFTTQDNTAYNALGENLNANDKKLYANDLGEGNGDNEKKVNNSCDELDSLCFIENFEKMSPFKLSQSDDALLSRQAAVVEKKSPNFYTKEMHYKVERVEHSATRNEIYLTLTSENKGSIKICTLQGSWLNTQVKDGDVVNIFLPYISSHVVINDQSGFIIVNPDLLISSTMLMSTLFCTRKAILQERFRGWDPGNFVMFLGSLVHQVFQEAVKNKITSKSEIMKIACSLLEQPQNMNEMYSQELTTEKVLEEVESYVPHIQKWMDLYVLQSSPLQNENKRNKNELLNDCDRIQVESVRDIEDSIWCPAYGIKGKIDLTLEVKIHSKKQSSLKMVPLELKTGRPTFSSEHEGQVILYSMMMNKKLEDFTEGLLLYLKDGVQMDWVKFNFHHVRSLIQLRNELAYYLQQQIEVPDDETLDAKMKHFAEPINNKRVCEKCPHLMTCCLIQKTVEDYRPSDSSHPMISLVPSSISHLSDSHLAYFKKWCIMLHLEMQASNNQRINAFWNEDSRIREENGMCFSKMVLMPVTSTNHPTIGESVLHKFHRAPLNSQTNRKSLKTVGITLNDRVAISNDSDLNEVAIAFGVVLEITDDYVAVLLENDLRRRPKWKECVFRLDRVAPTTTLSLQLTNLLRLMSCDPHISNLRQLLIDKKVPEFSEGLSRNVAVKGKVILKKMNKSQQRAIFKALMAKDYILIRGMPGTGKTSTIVSLVWLLVELGNSVLLTSYTHSAVDNILLKLKEHSVDFVRLGSLSRIHKDLHENSSELLTKNITDIAQLSKFYCSKNVVATTCLGSSHVLFDHRKFDVCIVDEASQVLQTACVGPLFHCKRFVLVGDPMQLPPIVQSKAARKMGMDESLFAALQSSNNTVDLTVQYRMNRQIMNLANKFTYKNLLTCGNENIENKTLSLPCSESTADQLLSNAEAWLSCAIGASICQSVLFLNLDNLAALEVGDKQGFYNNTEVQLVVQITELFVKGGLPEREMGIISPYRKQVSLIKESLQGIGCCSIEVNTVDQYQGRDKDVIIISFVRSNDNEKSDTEILNDERRINVAITRAKVKLIMIGSKSTLLRYKPLKTLISLLEPGQIMNLGV